VLLLENLFQTQISGGDFFGMGSQSGNGLLEGITAGGVVALSSYVGYGAKAATTWFLAKTGFVAGSPVPGLGNAIGVVGGAVVGWFGFDILQKNRNDRRNNTTSTIIPRSYLIERGYPTRPTQ